MANSGGARGSSAAAQGEADGHGQALARQWWKGRGAFDGAAGSGVELRATGRVDEGDLMGRAGLIEAETHLGHAFVTTPLGRARVTGGGCLCQAVGDGAQVFVADALPVPLS